MSRTNRQMIVHEYLWRGVIVECPCGRDFHVAEEKLAGFRCPCGTSGCLRPAEAHRAIEALMRRDEPRRPALRPRWHTARVGGQR